MSPTPTLGEYLTDWLDTVVAPTLRPATHRQYESVCRVWIIPLLGDVPMSDLTPARVQWWVATVYGSHLRPRSALQVTMVLRAALNRAVRWGILPASPLRQVSVPRSSARKPRPLTGAEAARFVVAVRGERLEACLLLALMVGLRRGELLGLQWQDVDFATARLSVRRQLSHGRDGNGATFAPLKTGSSERTVNLPTLVLEALRQHRGAQETEALRAGTRGWTDAGLVFCRRDGKPLGDGPLTAAWRRSLARAGIERRSFHSARHTAATLLMENGVHPKVVQVTLGHARIEQTMNVYTSVSVDAQAAASRAMDQLFCGAGETATGSN